MGMETLRQTISNKYGWSLELELKLDLAELAYEQGAESEAIFDYISKEFGIWN